MNYFEKLLVNSKLKYFFDKKCIFPSFFNFIDRELKGNILEIGCGIGNTTNLISTRYKKTKIIAIDYDYEQIKITNRKNKNRKIKFQQGDATNLKFKNDTFDYIIEANVFHHIRNYETAIKEVRRVLKIGGKFYLMDLSKYFFTWPFGLFFPPESKFTKKEFVGKLESDGFKVLKSKGNLLFFVKAEKSEN